jgi:hypothetical protein
LSWTDPGSTPDTRLPLRSVSSSSAQGRPQAPAKGTTDGGGERQAACGLRDLDAEFARITATVRCQFRTALRRISENAAHLQRWREGGFAEGSATGLPEKGWTSSPAPGLA